MIDMNDIHGVDPDKQNSDLHQKANEDKVRKILEEARKKLPNDVSMECLVNTMKRTENVPWELDPDVYKELEKRQKEFTAFCKEHNIPTFIHTICGVKEKGVLNALGYSMPVSIGQKEGDRIPCEILWRWAILLFSMQRVSSYTHHVALESISMTVKHIVDHMMANAVGAETAKMKSDTDNLKILLSGMDMMMGLFGDHLGADDVED